jgi:hypothetical protein
MIYYCKTGGAISLCFMHNATVMSVTWVFGVVYLTHLAINEDVTLRIVSFSYCLKETLTVLFGVKNGRRGRDDALQP